MKAPNIRLSISLLLIGLTNPADAAEITPTRSFTYKSVGDVELKMDLFEPEGLTAC